MSGMVPSRHRERTQACAERVCAKMYAWMICSVYDVYGFRSYRLLRHLGPECTQESHASGSHWARNLFAACTGRWVEHGGFLRSWDNITCLCESVRLWLRKVRQSTWAWRALPSSPSWPTTCIEDQIRIDLTQTFSWVCLKDIYIYIWKKKLPPKFALSWFIMVHQFPH